MVGPIKCVQRVRNRLLDPDGPVPEIFKVVDEPGTEINVGTIKRSLTAADVRVKSLEQENRDLRLRGLLQLDELRERILGQGKFHVTDPAKVEEEYERRKKEWES